MIICIYNKSPLAVKALCEKSFLRVSKYSLCLCKNDAEDRLLRNIPGCNETYMRWNTCCSSY